MMARVNWIHICSNFRDIYASFVKSKRQLLVIYSAWWSMMKYVFITITIIYIFKSPDKLRPHENPVTYKLHFYCCVFILCSIACSFIQFGSCSEKVNAPTKKCVNKLNNIDMIIYHFPLHKITPTIIVPLR